MVEWKVAMDEIMCGSMVANMEAFKKIFSRTKEAVTD